MIDVPQFVLPKKTVGQVLQKVGKATASALVVLTGKDIKSVRNAVKILYTTNKIHIGSYELNKRGKVSRVWYWGDGDDAREPVVSKQTFVPRPDVAASWLTHVQK